jgi:hypothetical protein
MNILQNITFQLESLGCTVAKGVFQFQDGTMFGEVDMSILKRLCLCSRGAFRSGETCIPSSNLWLVSKQGIKTMIFSINLQRGQRKLPFCSEGNSPSAFGPTRHSISWLLFQMIQIHPYTVTSAN